MNHWPYPCLKQQRFWLMVVVLLLITCNETHGCASVPRKADLSPIEQLLAAVNEAESRMEDDAIILPKAPVEPLQVIVPKGLVFISLTNDPVKPEPEQDVPEIPLGTMVNFSCSRQRSGQTFSDTTVLWRHHKTDIYTNATVPLSPASFFYSYSRVGQQSFFFVHNVSTDSAGPVQCLQQCDDGWCVVEEFQLRPQLRASDVFYGRLQNATSQCGRPISHSCKVRMNCSPGTIEPKDTYYTWKLDDSFAGVPHQHSYLNQLQLHDGVRQFLQRRKLFPPGVQQIRTSAVCARSAETGMGYYEEVLTIVPEMPIWGWCPSLSPHRVQCWFRPNNTGRRWLVQAAFAHY